MKTLIKAGQLIGQRRVDPLPPNGEEDLICKRHAAKWQEDGYCRGCYLTPEDAEHAISRGKSKGDSRQFRPLKEDYSHVPDTIVGPNFLAHLNAVLHDEVKLAKYVVDGRRKAASNSIRSEIAKRAAAREPMLNADPSQTTRALEGKHHVPKNARIDKLAPFKRIVVKPNSALTGKHGWNERLWTIHNLRYARGMVGVTDQGEETLVFPDWGSMRRSIKESGWLIIREEVRQGGERK